MGYASQSGRARTSSRNPQAHAICDRCGFRYNFVDLSWQYDWRGSALQNLRILVCRPCNDRAQEQLRAIVLPADPTPIINARPELYQNDETDWITVNQQTVYDPVSGLPVPPTTTIVTQGGEALTNQPYGAPQGLEQAAIMPLQGNVAYGTPLAVVSISANGTNTITVTCSAVTGLTFTSQISVAGVSASEAVGFFTPTIISATAFSYDTSNSVASGSLLTSETRILTANVGVPYNYAQIPLSGT